MRFLGLVPLACLLLSPFAFATAVTVNGSCQVGPCLSSSSITDGGSITTPFSFVYVLPNTDRYQATGTIAAAATVSTFSITSADISLSYLGNMSGTASGSDTLVIDFLQYFTAFGSFSNNSGYEYISGSFSGGYSNASSVEAQAFSAGGTAMALMGPFFPPNSFTDFRSEQPVSGSPLFALDFRDTVTFGAGSTPGATIDVSNVPSAPTPEPAPCLLLLTGSLFAGLLKWRRPVRL